MPNWYQFKYVCVGQGCGAVHYYRPRKGCQKCGRLILKKIENKGDEMKEEELELRLQIDRYALEDEWVSHPQMYYQWAEKAVRAQAEFDKWKSYLDLVRAEVSNDIRKDPDHYDLPDKITESVISNAIIVHPEYKAAVKKVNSSRYELQIAQAAVNALEHKKRALSLLVELWIRQYYSDPQIKGRSEEGRDFDKREVRSRGRRSTVDLDGGIDDD